MNKIDDYVYLGSSQFANSIDECLEHDIKHVISLRPMDPVLFQQCKNKVNVYNFYVPHHKFSKKFFFIYHQIMDIIEIAKSKNECVLIHCLSGQHRSAAIVIGYMMKQYQLTYQKAFDKVKEKRNCVEDVYIISDDMTKLSLNPKFDDYFKSKLRK